MEQSREEYEFSPQVLSYTSPPWTQRLYTFLITSTLRLSLGALFGLFIPQLPISPTLLQKTRVRPSLYYAAFMQNHYFIARDDSGQTMTR
jgi:hypothetical protein